MPSGAFLSIKCRMIELYSVIRAFTSQVLFVVCCLLYSAIAQITPFDF